MSGAIDGNASAEQVIYEWIIPADYPRFTEGDDVPLAFRVVSSDEAVCGVIVNADWEGGKWEANPWSTRPLIRHLISELAALREENERLKEAQGLLDKWGLALLEKLGDLVRRAAVDGPLTTCIECTVGGDERGERVPIVWLWATSSDKEPVARLHELGIEKGQLKERLSALLADGSKDGVSLTLEELEEIEWSGRLVMRIDAPEDAEFDCCSSCRGIRPGQSSYIQDMAKDDPDYHEGHHAACWLAAKIRAAKGEK